MANFRKCKFISKKAIKRFLFEQPHPMQNSEEFTERLDAEIEMLIVRAIRRSRANGRKRLMGQDV